MRDIYANAFSFMTKSAVLMLVFPGLLGLSVLNLLPPRGFRGTFLGLDKPDILFFPLTVSQTNSCIQGDACTF